MSVWTVVELVLAAIGWIVAAVIAWKWVWLARRVLDLEGRIEWCLDRLDLHYGTLARVLEVPVASDDPVAREAVAAIKAAHDDVLVVANELGGEQSQQGEEEENE